jgi:hypothetical protein
MTDIQDDKFTRGLRKLAKVFDEDGEDEDKWFNAQEVSWALETAAKHIERLRREVVRLKSEKNGVIETILTFKNLYIKANDENIFDFIDLLTTKISASTLWRSDGVLNFQFGGRRVHTRYDFSRKCCESHPSAILNIFPTSNKDNGNFWHVPNVISLDVPQLSCKEYNYILTEFYELFVKPTANELNIDVELFNSDILED